MQCFVFTFVSVAWSVGACSVLCLRSSSLLGL